MTTEALPEFDVPALRAGVASLGLVLTDAQIIHLSRFSGLLVRWNRVHNLTAVRADDEILTHHLFDSLALVRPLRDVMSRRGIANARVLDVGSGGGLPGIPLAIACPDLEVTLVDAVKKKTAFLTQATLELQLKNVVVRHARVEALTGEFDVITSRAFAALANFVAWTRHLLARDGCWLAMKARIDPAELAALPNDVQVVAVLPLVVPGLGEQRHLVEIQPR